MKAAMCVRSGDEGREGAELKRQNFNLFTIPYIYYSTVIFIFTHYTFHADPITLHSVKKII